MVYTYPKNSQCLRYIRNNLLKFCSLNNKNANHELEMCGIKQKAKIETLAYFHRKT